VTRLDLFGTEQIRMSINQACLSSPSLLMPASDFHTNTPAIMQKRAKNDFLPANLHLASLRSQR